MDNDIMLEPALWLVVGGGEVDRLSANAGPGMAVLADERGVCGLVRYDERDGIAYDDGAEVTR